MGLLVIAGFLTSGCSLSDLPRFGWPVSATEQGRYMQYFWSAAFIAALAVGVVVWAAMFWAFVRYRKRRNGPLYPKQTKENLPFELVCTALPFVLVAVLFYFTVTTENKVVAKAPNPDVVIDVTAFKWNWDFGYEGTTVPGALPATDKDADWYNATEVHTIGTSSQIPVLVLPNGANVEFRMRSRDVIHSFWVPDFLFKRDVFPYPVQNQPDAGNTFQVRLERTGAFVGRCAELCGTFHSAMNFEVRSVPKDVYDAYVALRQKTNPATGQVYKSPEALAEVGKQFPQCGQLCAPLATTTYPFDTERTAREASQNQNASGN